MKVLARINDSRILVEMEDAELAKVTGHARMDAPELKSVVSEQRLDYGGYYWKFRLGTTVDVSKIFAHYHSILAQREHIIAAQTTLRAAASLLNPAKDFITEAIKPEEK